MSGLQAKWAILTPVKKGAIITKADRKQLGDIMLKGKNQKSMGVFAPKEKLKNAKGKLSKKMRVLTITDKQFGMMNLTNNKDLYEAAKEVATTMQKLSIYTIQ